MATYKNKDGADVTAAQLSDEDLLNLTTHNRDKALAELAAKGHHLAAVIIDVSAPCPNELCMDGRVRISEDVVIDCPDCDGAGTIDARPVCTDPGCIDKGHRYQATGYECARVHAHGPRPLPLDVEPPGWQGITAASLQAATVERCPVCHEVSCAHATCVVERLGNALTGVAYSSILLSEGVLYVNLLPHSQFVHDYVERHARKAADLLPGPVSVRVLGTVKPNPGRGPRVELEIIDEVSPVADATYAKIAAMMPKPQEDADPYPWDEPTTRGAEMAWHKELGDTNELP